MCVFYDPHLAKKCREDDAEEVKAKEQANFCDYFRARPGAFDSALAAAGQKARDELAALFGAAPAAGRDDAQRGPADSLFEKEPRNRR